MFKRLFALAASLLMVAACTAQEPAAKPAETKWVAGTHYFVIDTAVPVATPGKVEVLEVFSYSCPHCAHFQPYADELKSKLPKSASFSYLPAVFHPQWEPFARAYLTAEAMGVVDKVHQATFDALHRDHKQLDSITSIAAFYAGLGVDQKAFLSTAQSFVIEGKLSSSQSQLQKYGIDGTPSIVVNGKYRLTGQSAGGLPQMVELTLFLVQKELAANGSK
jgi:thiol:disulfide interchange protein DsbA